MKKQTLLWKVSTTGLFKEILVNIDPKSKASLAIPIDIFLKLLAQVGTRAAEINDKELNKLMMRLGLYSISNPDDPEYNPKLVSEYLDEEFVVPKPTLEATK